MQSFKTFILNGMPDLTMKGLNIGHVEGLTEF
jgi:hypothetical protein